ncbi:aminotransferase class I/II-fold pyridoxal phosphate-dependent enzyme [Aquibacillus sp. 3ASR75-11]|uniref:Aminotransferase class I/II-fold pyridoxal phosphate-dependent enzyme n=1 Tax=Terrihalobacillus insolitus TaxID=2950438 RepID=A0A9X4APZ2_9BACI|nr:aminotransferase class I/II-fold pyridoxal phosphate-dependent enzyme [Terrihalobacillus insolitus]MDC3414891.1 aminotransferase class I/II-fold pyridoxal phosphate-dependent enzyme [Terrihalobacillus insolitus]MDC3426040.1 aminotransferase class I/II-fold pyridoxal phosphate-dependent enzyme [Terrihalobacillus insolitus]
MTINQKRAPLYEALYQFSQGEPISFHVPGHKNGKIFSRQGEALFKHVLSLDVTELTGLDDLHEPTGVIHEAQQLSSDWFGADDTFFLVGGSTVGNLAMILSTSSRGDKVIVQRNCHKSILNGLELAGVKPIFVASIFQKDRNRYVGPSVDQVIKAIKEHPEAKSVILTYPDYFGMVFPLEEIIRIAHSVQMPVLIDEAHGVHFSTHPIFPKSSLELGADIVIQSAHKMAPAMTMGAYLHVRSSLVVKENIAYYLQLLQSSSPSYPILASLDLARHFLANQKVEVIHDVHKSVKKVKNILSNGLFWNILESDDPLKIILQVNKGYNGREVAYLFEQEKIYPELSTHDQLLFIHGLEPFENWSFLSNAIDNIVERLKLMPNHATIEEIQIPQESIQMLRFSYDDMKNKAVTLRSLDRSIGCVAAEAVVPYPPGIPLIVKGEVVTETHIKAIHFLLDKEINFQNRNIKQGFKTFK